MDYARNDRAMRASVRYSFSSSAIQITSVAMTSTTGPSRVFGCCDAVDPADDWARATRIVSLLTVAFGTLPVTLCTKMPWTPAWAGNTA